MSDEERGFVVRDKRGRTESRDEETPPTFSKPEAFSSSASADLQSDASQHQGRPPITFSSFVFSLGTSALMLMGEPLDPNQPSPPVNLPQAKEIIDILSMLEEKTGGNLSTEETSVIRDMLYTLRMKFVSVSPAKGNTASF